MHLKSFFSIKKFQELKERRRKCCKTSADKRIKENKKRGDKNRFGKTYSMLQPWFDSDPVLNYIPHIVMYNDYSVVVAMWLWKCCQITFEVKKGQWNVLKGWLIFTASIELGTLCMQSGHGKHKDKPLACACTSCIIILEILKNYTKLSRFIFLMLLFLSYVFVNHIGDF